MLKNADIIGTARDYQLLVVVSRAITASATVRHANMCRL
jgi:hypothetical protein